MSEGGTGARAAGVPHAHLVEESLPKARAAQAPIFHGDNRDIPAGGSGTRDRREWSYEDDGMDDDELDDRDHSAEPPLDRAFARLVDYIYERFPHSEPQSAAPSAPRCEYETYFAVADPPELARKFMRLYPRVSEIQKSVHDYAANLSRESRHLFRVLPSRRRAFSIGDEPDFCRQQFINSDFARICRSISVAKSRKASVSLADLERLDRVSRMILAGDSQCYWFLSALLVQLKEDGYQPSNPSLFDKSISSLSSALATQTNVTSCLSEFITAKRRESYLSHSSFTLPESLKRDLLVAPGTDSLLFNQPLLSSAIENMKEDSLLSSTSSLSSISKAAIKSKSQGGSGKYTSPLDAPRAGTSGFRKRSSSPYRRGSKRGRGAAPSSSRGRGFRRQESCPCPTVVGGCLSLRWRIWSDEGADPWVMEVLREGYRIPFWRAPTLSREPIPFSAYCPNSIRGKALEQEVESLLQKGAIELAPLTSLGYYSRQFVVMKASGSWRPVIDLSHLNLKVLKTPFKMETIQSTLMSVRRGIGWSPSISKMLIFRFQSIRIPGSI